jgi:hypothetical protein
MGIYSKGVKNFIFPIYYYDGAEYLSDADIKYYRGEKIYSPVYRMGTYTAVYVIYDQNKIIRDNIRNEYILRVYQNESNTKIIEPMFNISKIKNEYKLFNIFLSKIYYYGLFKQLKTEAGFYVEYNITKQYNTPIYDREDNILNMTNRQKFRFLLSNVEMLGRLYINNYIHADYKLANVGWDNSNTMNVILLDYDIYTLQKLEESNPEFEYSRDGLILKSPSTYVPEYIKYNKRRNTIESYDKYSVGGLYYLIKDLKIKFTMDKYTYDLGNSLRLDSPNYGDIPKYVDMYDILLSLQRYLMD